MRRKKKKKRNRRKLRWRRGRGFSNAHLLMIVGCLLKVSPNLQQFKPAKQDINIKLKCKIRRMRPEKLIFSSPTVGAKNVCVIMWPILNTHTSTRSLYEGSSQYEHCIVHPKFHLQIDLLSSISRGLLCLISSDWRYKSNKTLKNEGFERECDLSYMRMQIS